MNVIAPSELIINTDGSIYHLNVRPEEISETIITVGDPDRVKMVSDCFDEIEMMRQHREFHTHTGRFKGRRLTVVSSGIGTDNIDIVFNEIDALFNIDFKHRKVKTDITPLHFIRIGTSGTLREAIPVDSFLVSEAAIGLDNLMHFYHDTIPPNWAGFYEAFLSEWQYTGISTTPYIGASTSPLLDQCDDSIIKGVTLTAPGFYAPQGRKLRAKSYTSFLKDNILNFEHGGRQFTNFEMETAAMYGLANTLGHHAISFNVILANRQLGEFTKNSKASVNRLIEVVLDMIVSQ